MHWLLYLIAWLFPQDAPFSDPRCSGPWIWPLQGHGFEPRRLIHTHGQLVEVRPPGGEVIAHYAHPGIDIQAKKGELVRAVTDGYVVTKKFNGPGEYGNYLVIAPDFESSWGVLYQHVGEVFVYSGQYVPRGLVIGEVAEYLPWAPAQAPSEFAELPYTHYRHLHLAIVSMGNLLPCDQDGELEQWNPLPMLSARSDSDGLIVHGDGTGLAWGTTAPSGGGSKVDLGEITGPALEEPEHVLLNKPGQPKILFFQQDGDKDPTSHTEPFPVDATGKLVLKTGKIAMAIRLNDFSPSRPDGAAFSYHKVMPQRISVTARRWIGALTTLAEYRRLKPLEVVYCNEVRLNGPLPPGAAENLYRLDDTPDGVRSQGNESVHDFYFDLCSTPDAKGVWEVEAPGHYLVEVVAEDVGGNVAHTHCIITVKGP